MSPRTGLVADLDPESRCPRTDPDRNPLRPVWLTLSNSINSFSKKSLKENELKALIDELVKRGVVIVNSNEKNVSYKLKK